MKCFLLLLCLCLFIVNGIHAQSCEEDLRMVGTLTYPGAELMRDAAGKGDYGYFQPFSGYFDPGKWTVCHSQKGVSPGGAQYCYVHLGNETDFTVAACPPSSCSAEQLNQLEPEFVVAALGLPSEYAKGFVFDCTAPSYDLPWGTYILLTVLFVLFILVLVGSILDAQITYNIIPFFGQKLEQQEFSSTSINGKPQSEKKPLKLVEKSKNMGIRLLLCFSYQYNYSRLTSPSPPGSFEALNGIRVLAMMFVVIGHTFYFVWDTMAILNFQSIAQTVKHFRFQIVVAGFYAVDTFFFMSGFLVAYLFVKELKAKGISIKTMVMFYFHRIYRLTPCLVVGMFVFYLISPYWSNGPYWRFYQASVNSRCDSGWWYTVLYVQNLVDTSHLCMGWSWYLADDMQYYILSPLFLIAYWKNKYVGWAMAVIGIVVCIFTNYGISASNDLQEFSGFEFGAELGNYIPPGGGYGVLIYLPPWTRYAPYLAGFICAFILLERGPSFRSNLFVRSMIYVNSFLIIFILSFITWSDSNYGWENWMNVFWISVSRTIWSIGLGALILMCVTGYGGVFATFLSRPFWVPFARLSYGAYIYHLTNLSSIYLGYKSALTYSFSVVLYFFFGHLVIAFILSFASFFLVEKPLMNIESILIPRGGSKKGQ